MVWAKHATGFSVIPLRVASLAGICIAILGFLIGLILVGRYLFLGVETQGWASLVCLNLFLGGLVLVSLGIMGEYVGRSYLRLNSKPQYTIREVVGTEPQQTCGVERAIL